MNKAELVSRMAEKSELTKKEAEMAFETRERAARKGRNPRNPQQEIDIPASKAPVFKAGKSLKEAINEA